MANVALASNASSSRSRPTLKPVFFSSCLDYLGDHALADVGLLRSGIVVEPQGNDLIVKRIIRPSYENKLPCAIQRIRGEPKPPPNYVL
eukprot:6372193-Amphidinium_carterae.1